MTADNATSYAGDSTVNQSTCNALNSDQEIYLLKLEQKIPRVNVQTPFDKQLNTDSILKQLKALLRIALLKLKPFLNRTAEK